MVLLPLSLGAWPGSDFRSGAIQPKGQSIARSDSVFAIQDACENFEPLINEAGIDLWLSGHRHRFACVDPAAGQSIYR